MLSAFKFEMFLFFSVRYLNDANSTVLDTNKLKNTT